MTCVRAPRARSTPGAVDASEDARGGRAIDARGRLRDARARAAAATADEVNAWEITFKSKSSHRVRLGCVDIQDVLYYTQASEGLENSYSAPGRRDAPSGDSDAIAPGRSRDGAPHVTTAS